MRSKTELIKTASNLKAFTTKLKEAQEGIGGIGMAQTLTPEAVQDIALEITQVAEVAAELANEIAEGVPAEEAAADPLGREEKPDAAGPPQIETAQDGEEDEEKKLLKEQMASMKIELNDIKIAKVKETLATKYASLFTPIQRQAKMKEILEASDSIEILTAKVQEASNLINGKQVVKVASSGQSIFEVENAEGGEIDISSKI